MSESEALLLSSGNGPAECRQAVSLFLDWLSEQAAEYCVDLDVSPRTAPYGPASAVVLLRGRGAVKLARSVEGVILWRCLSQLRSKCKRKNWFIQVFRLPEAAREVQIDPATVETHGIRAGGPGGQHQNKTSSAIRARWTRPDGKIYAVVVRNNRSQHQNRRVALERLAALVSADIAEAKASQQGATWALHNSLQRGGPCRVFEGKRFLEAQ